MRKGQIADFATYIVFLFIIAVIFLITWSVIGTLNTTWENNELIPQHAKDMNAASFGSFGTVLDNSFLIMYVGTLLAALILSYVLQSNPGMFFVLLIVVFLLSIVAGYMGNAYTAITEETGLAGAAASFTTAGFIMENYLLLTFITITLMTVVFFAKPQGGPPL